MACGDDDLEWNHDGTSTEVSEMKVGEQYTEYWYVTCDCGAEYDIVQTWELKEDKVERR
jgi:hypothetical protein